MSIAVSSTPSGNPYIDGILYGTQWSGSITYSFADDLSDFGTYPYAISGFQQVSAAQQNAVQSILEGAVASGTAIFSFGSYSQIANIDISLAADPAGSSDITIGQTDMFDGSDLTTARVADFPLLSQGASGGDIWFGDNYDYRTPQVGSYAWATHIHELGHAMGLSHGHNAGTDIDGFKLAIPHDRDGMEFSVMTYRSFVGGLTNGYTNEQFGYAQTLMMYDIAAVQYLYGANFNTNSGGTTYTWSTTTGEMFVNGVGQGKPGDGVSAAANRLFLTIWMAAVKTPTISPIIATTASSISRRGAGLSSRRPSVPIWGSAPMQTAMSTMRCSIRAISAPSSRTPMAVPATTKSPATSAGTS